MCDHKWTRLKRSYQYQTDRAEGKSFVDSKVWIKCEKCPSVKGVTVRKLMTHIPTDFREAISQENLNRVISWQI